MGEYNVTLPAIEKEFHMEVIYASTDYRSIRITVEDVARPGLSLAGYFDHFEPRRLQVLGNMEWSYLNKKAPQERLVIFDRLLDYKIPALLICRSLPVDEECLDMAKKHNVSILRTDEATSTFCSNLISYLRAELAPEKYDSQGRASVGGGRIGRYDPQRRGSGPAWQELHDPGP